MKKPIGDGEVTQGLVAAASHYWEGSKMRNDRFFQKSPQ